MGKPGQENEPLTTPQPRTAGAGTCKKGGLDRRYDCGVEGSGAGRVIEADAGPVEISGPDGLVVSGKVGIGTTEPDTNPIVGLDVRGVIEAQATTTGGAAIETYNTLRTRVVAIGSQAQNGFIGLFEEDGSTIAVNMTATPGGRIWFNNGGNVGIGTSTPAAALDVEGKTITKVLEITGGLDLAEDFRVFGNHRVEKGAVVVIDDIHPGFLKVSDRAYDTCVAGIVSGAGNIAPGLTLIGTVATADTHTIALSGRVYVLADAGTSPIAPGDLLTSSAVPGRAMKATDRYRASGAVIGKAMSSLKNGQGLVLVLVNLG